MRILVASENPNKISGAKRAFEEWFGECDASGMKADPGVRDTPIGFDEAMEGLENRLAAITRFTGYDFYVALEGAVVNGFLVTFSLVSDGKRKWTGHSPGLKLPDNLVRDLEGGARLSDFAEKLTGIPGIKKKHGLLGHATRGIISREDSNYLAVMMALASRNLQDGENQSYDAGYFC